MAYQDLNVLHNPSTGGVAPASWGDQVRDNFEYLIDPPVCSVFNSAAQSLTTGTDTVLTANSENFDNNTMHSTISNTSRITFQTAGRYLLNANLTFATSSTGVRKTEFYLNGTTPLTGMLINATASPFLTDLQATRTRTFIVGDYVEVRAFQNSGGNLNVTLVEFVALFLTR